jgi:uncharacterized membrane-anchored protein YhcB (DUF1043 family)
MKKKFIFIVVIQTILIGLIFIYALIQKMTSDVQTSKLYQTEVELEKVKGELENCRNNLQKTQE